MNRRRLAAAAAAVLVVSLAPSGLATAAPSWTYQGTGTALDTAPATGGAARVAGPATTGPTTTATTAAISPVWLSRINEARAQFGVPAVTESAALTAGAQRHAAYMVTNTTTTHTENPALPGYTAAGAAAGPASIIASRYGTPAGYMTAWLSSPFDLMDLTDPRLTQVGVGYQVGNGGDSAAIDVRRALTASMPTTGWPRSYPRGSTTVTTLNPDGLDPDPLLGCPAPTGAWYGPPVLIDFGPAATITSPVGQLTQNGWTVPFCLQTRATYTAFAATVGDAGQAASATRAASRMAGKVLVIPLRPLLASSAYNFTLRSSAGSASVAFFTPVAATGVKGDQNGDRRADIMAIDAAGQLNFHGVRKNGTAIDPAFRPGARYAVNWMSPVADLNGDGRSELVVRRTDGSLWLYQGRGVGYFEAGVQIGRGFGALDNLTVMDDFTGDRMPELMARTGGGDLLYWRFTGAGSWLGSGGLLATGFWHSAIGLITSPGDFSGDGRPDLIATVRSTGVLRYYTMTRTGTVARPQVIGQGWGPYNRIFSPGDVSGDGIGDIIGRRGDGALFAFHANGAGGLKLAVQLGTGWDAGRVLG